jgi:uridine kinase
MSIERTVIVVVAGGTASGKSTIVSRLVERTGAVHISHDRYYFDAPNPRGHDFDHPTALDTDRMVDDVTLLKSGRSAELPVYQFASHSRSIEVELVEPAPLIVVEGILVLADPRVVALADVTVFVDAPEAVRFERRLARDISERGRTEDSVRAQYRETVKPNHDAFVEPSKRQASVVLDGTDDVERSVDRLVSLLPV